MELAILTVALVVLIVMGAPMGVTMAILPTSILLGLLASTMGLSIGALFAAGNSRISRRCAAVKSG